MFLFGRWPNHSYILEKIQIAASKILISVNQFSYEKRLDKIKLSTIEEQMERADLILMFKPIRRLEKIYKGYYGRIGGLWCQLKMVQCLNNLKFSFPNRSIDSWNELVMEVVQTGNSHNFKSQRDKSRYGNVQNELSSIFVSLYSTTAR